MAKKQIFEVGKPVKKSSLTFVSEYDSLNGKRRLIVKCQCGKDFPILLDSLSKKNPTQSCGCLTSSVLKAQKTKHGMCDSEMYKRWCGMKTRCYDTKDKGYERYGGRGILICDDWVNDFEAFNSWSINNGGHDGKRLQIDRIDNDKGYSPDNCRYVTNAVNARNKGVRRTNKMGISGIGIDKRSGKYYATITTNGKRANLGYYSDFFEACCARKSAENRYWR